MARREFHRSWSAAPGLVHSEASDVIGFDLKGKKERGNNKSDQFLIGYSRIDPDGADGPFNQGSFGIATPSPRSLCGRWALEAQAQRTKRWEKYFEQSAQLNVGLPPDRPADADTECRVHASRSRQRITLEDRDLRFFVNQALPSIPGLSVSAESRENDITGEDDFTFGAVFRRWSCPSANTGSELSYTLNLKPPA